MLWVQVLPETAYFFLKKITCLNWASCIVLYYVPWESPCIYVWHWIIVGVIVHQQSYVHCTACATLCMYMHVLVVITYLDFSFFLTGSLTSVLNLETESGRSSINVSWGAPFTLDVTDEGPDIWYSVLIYNVTDEENPTTVPCTDCHYLTQTHYVFSPHIPSPCHKYAFAVISHNGVGEGETSKNVTGYSINSEFCVQTTCITHGVCTHTWYFKIVMTLMCHYGAYKALGLRVWDFIRPKSKSVSPK